MNQDNAQLLVSGRLNDVTPLEGASLLVGKYLLNQYELGTYFVDYSDEGFPADLRAYQEQHISSFYYKNSGHKQWNNYLIFLRDSYDDEIRKDIENDSIYTRKFIFTPEEFNNYFDYQISEQSIQEDVTGIWKEKLREVDLDEVYSDAYYAQAIPRYLSNEVIKDLEGTETQEELGNVFVVERVSSIQLDENYRKFPLIRDFNLGHVNLITGANGVGKTSFLESIELVIGGKSFRSPNSGEAQESIKARYNDDFDDVYTPGSNAKYRSRDRFWYSSSYPTGNNLFKAFNKYNFYDSDAAYNLSNSTNFNELTGYLSSIALGTEFKQIQERMQRFKERLNAELRNRSKIIEQEESRISDNKEILNNTDQTLSPQESIDSFLEFADQIAWSNELPNNPKGSFQKFNSDYEKVKSLLDSLINLSNSFKLLSQKSFSQRVIILESAIVELEKRRSEIEKEEANLDSKRKALSTVEKTYEVLEIALKYYSNEKSFELTDLKERIDSISANINQKSRALEFIERISDPDFFQRELTLESFKEEQYIRKQELTKRRKELDLKNESIKSNLNELQRIVAEIKSYGNQYLSVDKSADSCPLCGTPYSFEELSERISTIAKDIDSNVALDDLTNQITEIDRQIEKGGRVEADIELAESFLITISEPETLTMELIGQLVEKLEKNLIQQKQDKAKLNKLAQDLEDNGLNEDEFNSIRSELEELFEGLEFTVENKESFQTEYLKISELKNDSVADISKSEIKVNESRRTFIEYLERVYPGIKKSEYNTVLTFEIDQIKKGLEYYNELVEYFEVPENESILDTSQKLDQLNKLYSKIDDSLLNLKESAIANQNITESEKRINDLKPICTRITTGLEVIDEILTDYGEAKVLGDFIEKNELEIQEIFKSIHSPKEFSEIKFSQERNGVFLKRSNEDTLVPINKISTGQRSALALSIFLALNKKLQNGPNLILFDDPVSFTDDLNVLSFLDYLREMAIHENRQIIFATANQKLAGLFEKKFAFMGSNNFRKFHFKR